MVINTPNAANLKLPTGCQSAGKTSENLITGSREPLGAGCSTSLAVVRKDEPRLAPRSLCKGRDFAPGTPGDPSLRHSAAYPGQACLRPTDGRPSLCTCWMVSGESSKPSRGLVLSPIVLASQPPRGVLAHLLSSGASDSRRFHPGSAGSSRQQPRHH